MNKIKIKWSIVSDCGRSRSYEEEISSLGGYFENLIDQFDNAVELFKLRQEKKRQNYIKKYNKDPFEE